MLGGCGAAAGADDVIHLANGQAAALASGTGHTAYIMDGATAQVALPSSVPANKGQKVTINFGLGSPSPNVMTLNSFGGAENIQVPTGGGFSPGFAISGNSFGTFVYATSVTWESDGAGAWYLIATSVYSQPPV